MTTFGAGSVGGPGQFSPLARWASTMPTPPAQPQGVEPTIEGLRTGSAAQIAQALGGCELPQMELLQTQLRTEIGELDGQLERLGPGAGTPKAREAHANGLACRAQRDHLQALLVRVEVEVGNRAAALTGGNRVDPLTADRYVDFRRAQVGLAEVNQRYVQADVALKAAQDSPAAAADVPELMDARNEAADQVRSLVHTMQRDALVRVTNDTQESVVARWSFAADTPEEMWHQVSLGMQELSILDSATRLADCYAVDGQAGSCTVSEYQGDLRGAVEANLKRAQLVSVAPLLSQMGAQAHELAPQIRARTIMTEATAAVDPGMLGGAPAARESLTISGAYQTYAGLHEALIGPLNLCVQTQASLALPPQGPLHIDAEARRPPQAARGLTAELPSELQRMVQTVSAELGQTDQALGQVKPLLTNVQSFATRDTDDMLAAMRRLAIGVADRLSATPERPEPPDTGSFLEFANNVRGYSPLVNVQSPERLVGHALHEAAPQRYFVEPRPLAGPQTPPVLSAG